MVSISKSILVILIIICSISFAAEAAKYQYIVNNYDQGIGNLPIANSILSGETIKVIVAAPEGETNFGFKTSSNGAVSDYSETPYSDSTVALYVSDKAAQELQTSSSPALIFRKYWGNEIHYQGLNLFSSIKLTFFDLVYRIFSIFSPPSTVITEPPTPIAASSTSVSFDNLFSGDQVITCEDVTEGAAVNAVYLDGTGENVESQLPNPIKQKKNITCVPNSLIWILQWLNQTHPGLVTLNRSDMFTNLTSGLVINANGTRTGSIPGAVARYINSTGKNSSIKIYGNWTDNNGTSGLVAGGDTVMVAGNKSVVVGGQGVDTVNNTDYFNAISYELNKGEGVLILFDHHAVAAVKVDDKDTYTIEVMDPAQGEFVGAEVAEGQMTVYDKFGQPYRKGPIVAIIAISPDKLGEK